MNKENKIFVSGHNGLVGSSLVRALKNQGYENIIIKERKELDLTDSNAVSDFFKSEKIDFVFNAAAKVGGILANKDFPADFIYQNLVIQNNIIHHSYLNGVKKLLFLGSSCIYPKLATQPITEEALLSGPLEETNKSYAVAKIAGIVMCQSYNRQYGTNFISVMPTNLYGPNDNFDLQSSHVLPALIRKFDEAKNQKQESVTIWGSGTARREFLHVDDLAKACIHIMNTYDESEIINIGTGEDISIKDLALMIKEIVGFEGNLVFDNTKPDGTPRKVLDVSKLRNLGFSSSISLREGIISTYEWYKSNYKF